MFHIGPCVDDLRVFVQGFGLDLNDLGRPYYIVFVCVEDDIFQVNENCVAKIIVHILCTGY